MHAPALEAQCLIEPDRRLLRLPHIEIEHVIAEFARALLDLDRQHARQAVTARIGGYVGVHERAA